MMTARLVLVVRIVALATTGLIVAGVSPLLGAILGSASAVFGAVKAKKAMGLPMLIAGVVTVAGATASLLLSPVSGTESEIVYQGPIVYCSEHPATQGC